MATAVPQSIDDVQDRIIREMNTLGDRLDRYEYLIGLGRELESPEGVRREEYQVPGCQSRVWIRAEVQDGLLRLAADSDALITRGIVALLLRVLDGHPPAEVRDAQLYFLDETGLRAHLSPSRANGLGAMVEEIRMHARTWG